MFPLNVEPCCSFTERLQAYALPPLSWDFCHKLPSWYNSRSWHVKWDKEDEYGGLVISSNKSWCYMKVLSKIWHVFLMSKLFFILVKTFQFIEHLDNSWVDLEVTRAQNQDSTQKWSGMTWVTTDKFDSKFCTEFGQCRENQCWTINKEHGCLTEGGQIFSKEVWLNPTPLFLPGWVQLKKQSWVDLHLMNPWETTPVTAPILGKRKLKEIRANLLADLFQVQHCLWILSLSPH